MSKGFIGLERTWTCLPHWWIRVQEHTKTIFFLTWQKFRLDPQKFPFVSPCSAVCITAWKRKYSDNTKLRFSSPCFTTFLPIKGLKKKEYLYCSLNWQHASYYTFSEPWREVREARNPLIKFRMHIPWFTARSALLSHWLSCTWFCSDI